MQIIENTTDFCISEKTAVTFGKFDGVHLGHQRLLDALLEQKKMGLKTVVFTFSAPPVETPENGLLTSNKEKACFLEQYGIDYLVIYPFTDEVRKTAPEQFVREVIAGKLNAAYLAAGPDFGFGFRRQGNVSLLKAMEGECGYKTKVLDKVVYDGKEISSSRIRQAVIMGRMEEAQAMLRRPYCLAGEVIHGRSLGNTIGFATMNLPWPEEKLCPPRGVYFVRARLENEAFDGLANIGLRPTVEKDLAKSDLLLEAHLLQYNQLAYGKRILVSLLHYERPEQRFSDLASLQKQLQKDKKSCQSFFEMRDKDGEKSGF